jgi:hypothetical protein
MNKIIFIDTKQQTRVRRSLGGATRVLRHAPGASRLARPMLTCVWRVDPDTGGLAACWSLEAVDDPTHWPHKLHFSKSAARIVLATRAA